MTGQFARGFSTLTQEMTTDRLPVEGRITDWLVCSLLRKFPAQFDCGGAYLSSDTSSYDA